MRGATDPAGVAADEAYAAGVREGQASSDARMEAVIVWAVDYFGDTTEFPPGLAFALWGSK